MGGTQDCAGHWSNTPNADTTWGVSGTNWAPSMEMLLAPHHRLWTSREVVEANHGGAGRGEDEKGIRVKMEQVLEWGMCGIKLDHNILDLT